jgi:hypothetical protein
VQGKPGVKLAEVDGFAGVGFSLVPVLAHLKHHPGVELGLPLTEDFGGAEQ